MKGKLAVLLCLAVVFFAACSNTAEDINDCGSEPPRLVTVVGDREYDTVPGSCSWAAGGSSKEINMPWPPPLTGTVVPVEQEKTLGFIIHDTCSSPETARITLFGGDAVYHEEMPDDEKIQTVTLEGDSFTSDQQTVYFEYMFPLLDSQPDRRRYLLEVRLVWPGDGENKNSADYYVLLQPTEGEVLDAVERTAAAFVESSWKGIRERTAGCVTGDFLKAANGGGSQISSSFAAVTESSGWELLLWQDSTKEFELMEEPVLDVTNIGPETRGPYAEARVRYAVRAADGYGKQLWHFEEHLSLRLEDEEWKVSGMRRNGKPYHPSTDKAGWEVSAKTNGGLVRIGPFTSISHYRSVLSPGGNQAAFIGSNFGTDELWAGSIGKGEFSRVFYMDTGGSQSGENRGNMVLIKICDDGKVIFMVHGYISTGEYKGQRGFWIMELEKGASKPETLAFVPDARSEYYNSMRITEDDRYVLIQKTGQLYRIDLTDGTHQVLREDMPGYLTVVCYNEDATLMGWEKQTGSYVEIVLYDPVNDKETLIKTPEEGMRIDLLDISGKSAAVSLCTPELVHQGEDGDWPVGIEKILIYGLEGEIRDETIPPDGLYIGSAVLDAGQQALYYTAGDLREGHDLWMGTVPLFYVHSTGLYRKSLVSGESSRVYRLDGQVYYHPGQPGQRVLWYVHEMDQQGNGGQRGLVIGGDGSIDETERRYTNHHEEWSRTAAAGDRQYMYRLDKGDNMGRFVRIRQGREETLLEGKIRIYDLKIADDMVMFSTEPPDGQRPAKEYLYILTD